MSDADLSRTDQPSNPTERERRELDQLVETFRRTSPRGSRRDLLRWSAVAAGALATARYGVASAAPGGSTPAVSRYQDVEIEENATVTIPLDPFGQEVTLDPHRSVNWGAFWVMFPNVWGGLVRYDENAKVQLDLAESYTVSEDGKVYQFKIRSDAKYASGNQVKAEDFVASWKRALDPSRLSPMAQYMEHINGFTSYVSRKSKTLSVKAVDEATVEITLSRPYSYFLSYLASFVWSVVDPAVLAEHPDDFYLYDAGTGPWRVTEFDPAKQLVMEPNPNHYGGNSPSITKLVWSFVTGPSAANEALNLYKQDQAISADVPISLKSSVEGDPDLSKELKRIEPQGTTRSVAMDFNQQPFNDVRVRRALAQAIDRERWANEIWEGTWTPAQSFTPPVVAANSGYKPPELLGFDADAAKQLLEDAGFPNGEGLPTITYYEPSEDTDDEKARWKAFFTMVQENLGVTVQHDTSKTADQIQDLQGDNGGRQFDIVWWWNITETPHLVTEVFASNSPYMQGVFNWNPALEPVGGFDPGADSKTFDDLVAKADVELDVDTRNDQYRQAEELAIKNAVYIPLGHWVQMFVQKPWLQGTKQGSWTGRLPVWFDKDVVVLKH
ncbi:MAG: oligopeptide transport system substrate-binding protein [Thermomicrobiales bacterium]|jgi:ABC-type transport system substrate-binding protein|nr:oligopeptide transport system substrate-binding protein [Thermomicrobiales bacterium]MEA2525925.1 oligopeptide transport system substrate-binding protein [Thermomicrobiales bacterium]